MILRIGSDYIIKGKAARYIGKGKNTGQLMFRDKFSGAWIFVDEGIRLNAEDDPKTRVEIIYA